MHLCISYSKLSLLNYLQMKSLGNFSVQGRFSLTFLSMRNFLLGLISIYLEQLSFFLESFPSKSFSKNRFIYINVDIGIALYLVKIGKESQIYCILRNFSEFSSETELSRRHSLERKKEVDIKDL